MSIAFDAVSSLGPTSSSTSPIDFTHTPVGTPKGIIVFISTIDNEVTADISGVTYGGIAMTLVNRTVDTASEAGTAHAYFLGGSIPTGPQTVSVSHNGAGTARWFSCISVTAARDTELAGTGSGVVGNDTTNPSVTITGISGASYGAGLLYYGGGTIGDASVGSGMTSRATVDFGTCTAYVESSTTEQASGNLTIGFTAPLEDVALVGLAIQEIGGSAQNALFFGAPF